MSLVVFREVLEEIHRHDELQNRVTQEFHTLVAATENKPYMCYKTIITLPKNNGARSPRAITLSSSFAISLKGNYSEANLVWGRR